MLDNMNELEEIELSIENAKERVAKRDAFYRLLENKDFQDLISEGYFEKEAIRLVHLKTDFNMQDQANQINILNQIDSIGYLKRYFQSIIAFGNGAEKAIQENEEAREEILREAH